MGASGREVRAFAGDVAALRRLMASAAGPDGLRRIEAATAAVADLAEELVDAAALASGDPLTMALPPHTRPRPAVTRSGIVYADLALGGPSTVGVSGRPKAGQVVFGSEFGGQLRAYRAATGRGARKTGALKGMTVVKRRTWAGQSNANRVRLSAAEQRAVLTAAGRRLRRTTAQFRPFRPSGYWVFPTLTAHADRLVEAWERPLDDYVQEWARG